MLCVIKKKVIILQEKEKALINSCILKWRLEVLMSEMERISSGRAFHNFSAAP